MDSNADAPQAAADSGPHSEPRFSEILLVYKKSKLDLYVNERKNARYTELLEAGGAVSEGLHASHEAHQATLAEVKRASQATSVKVRTCYRARLSKEATPGALVVGVGGDGTLLDTSHKIAQATLLGVNSDPNRSVGFLCAAHQDNFAELLDAILSGTLRPTEVPRLFGDVDGTPLPFPVLNEVLVAHQNPAATVRCLMELDGVVEDQKSSGIWVSAPAGSTAAIASAGGTVQEITDPRLQFLVREPFGADGPFPSLLHRFVPPTSRLHITSRVRAGRIYLDGHHVAVPLPVDARLTLHSAATPLSLVLTPAMQARRAEVVAQQRKHVALKAAASELA